MKQFVIQDHIIDEIYNYIKDEAPEIPIYLKFAYVADQYAIAQFGRKVKGKHFDSKFIDDKPEVISIIVPTDIASYEKYTKCETIEELIYSKDFSFCFPKTTTKENFEELEKKFQDNSSMKESQNAESFLDFISSFQDTSNNSLLK